MSIDKIKRTPKGNIESRGRSTGSTLVQSGLVVSIQARNPKNINKRKKRRNDLNNEKY